MAPRERLDTLNVLDTVMLLYEIAFFVDKPYLITANIDVADGLANGTVGKLSHFELDDQNRFLGDWLLFPNGVGVKARGKVAGYGNAKGIGREVVPINRRSETVPLNLNRSMHAIRNHFPIKPACSFTIHKSKDGTFDKIAYKYSYRHIHNIWSM
ncbi:ATP-dependent DNA helicase [Trichonephila clavipes]|uniref:ATP-dependent DNA helicase n=1 Tax=Trichonephila clavipes TaxID=2585209 RepID=A0A8X6SUZ0_TRICX|nr:ATP-dependent DNA helicase [Trichonephila clavipes]